MGKGPYEDIPEENVIFHYASSRNISFEGEEDSGYTIEEWAEMTDEEKSKALEDWMWGAELIELWDSEG